MSSERLREGAWRVDRVDDHGTRFQVIDGLTREEAEQVVTWYEARGHKQTYFMERSDDPERWGLHPRVVEVEVVDAQRHLLRLTFVPGGFVRLVDLSDGLWGPAFEPVADPEVFAQVRVDEQAGTIVWPNGADWSPTDLFLRSRRRPTR
jgi:hypothetical protein